MTLVARPDFRHLSRGLWYVFDLDARIIIRDGFASKMQAEEWIKHDDPVLRDITRSAIRRVWEVIGIILVLIAVALIVR